MTYLTIDLEFATIPNFKRFSKKLSKEIIQIGCVIMDENFEIINSYSSYIKPAYGGVLDRYVSDLTGITNQDLANAPSAKDVLEYLSSMVDEDTYFVTWSENDCRQLEAQLELEYLSSGKKVDVSDIFIDSLYDYIDCQVIFGEIMHSNRRYRLSEALCISNIAECSDKYHDAYADAYNTALLFRKTQLEDDFTFSPFFIPADIAQSFHYDPFKQRCLA